MTLSDFRRSFQVRIYSIFPTIFELFGDAKYRDFEI